MRILILEDEVFVALDLEETLRAQGHEVFGPAGTLEEAHEILAATKIDFALLDANIRGLTPKALAEEMVRRGIPFAYVTGYDEAYIRENLPGADYLPKPLSIEALKRLLENRRPCVERALHSEVEANSVAP